MMIAALLAAATVAAAPAGAPAPGADFKPPEWIRRPTPQDLAGAFPIAARYFPGADVILDCEVDIKGEPRDCGIDFENPAGMDFGWAADKMRTLFHFRPATLSGRPVPARVKIPIHFQGQVVGAPNFTPRQITLVTHPVWSTAPGFADLGAAYPSGAEGAAGDVGFRCTVSVVGVLGECEVDSHTPVKPVFTRAAFRLLPKFHMVLDPEALAPGKAVRVDFTIHLIDPASPAFTSRRLERPTWTAGFDPATAQKLFPPEAATRGLTSGLGMARCVVAADGALTGCSPMQGDPDGMGFSEAAVKLASAMKMNPWTAAGGPVDGATVNLPIRFKLAAAKPGP